MFKVQYFKDDEWHDLIGYPKMTLEQAKQCWMDYTQSFKDEAEYRIEKID